MASVVVTLPSLLAQVTGGTRRVSVSGASIREALDDLIRQYPSLGVHLYDETGSFREHVICFVNETNTRWLESLNHPVEDGDTLTILQAVSGG